MDIEGSHAGGLPAIRVHLAEEFTAREAGALHRLAGRVPRGTTLEVDFSAVRDCHDVALLILARDVRDGAARFAFRGLTHHQARLLEYLGARVQQAGDGVQGSGA